MINVLINGNSSTALIDGKLYMKSECTEDEITKLQELVFSYQKNQAEETKQQIISIFDFQLNKLTSEKQQVEEEVKLNKIVIENDLKFSKSFKNEYPEIFIEIDGNFYLKGFESVSLPEAIIEKIILCKKNGEDITAYINFWKLCLLNPNPEARKGLFKYVSKQNLIVTNKGYIVCYRRIVSKSSEAVREDLDDYVTSEVLRIKRNKTSINHFSIAEVDKKYITLDHRTEKYKTFMGNIIGPITELYKNSNERSKVLEFTDAHTKTMSIRLGEPIQMDRALCNEDAGIECSRGLHVGTPYYIGQGSSLGDTIILALVNPMHVVSVPYSDAHKMRVCEYYFSAILKDMNEVNAMNSSKIAVFEEEYSDYEMEELESILQSKEFETENHTSEKIEESKSKLDSSKSKLDSINTKIKEYRFSKDPISNDLSLEEIKNIIKSRLS